ncbi:MAG: hypothetical protein GX582_05990, partial [Acholeplasmataceae bacterium]|nr:hypothetical protein [Acholeplasmataceae bacterium]
MDYFMFAVITTYLFAIFLLALRAKVSHKTIRPAKIILIIFFALSVVLFFLNLATSAIELVTQIVALLPLPYILGMIYFNELKSFLKRIGLIRGKKQRNAKTDNDLADKLLETVDFLSNRKIGALITVERNINLSAFISKAMMINAPVS